MSRSIYTTMEVIEAITRVATFCHMSLQPSTRFETSPDGKTFRVVGLRPHRGRNAPKRISNTLRRKLKKKQQEAKP